MFCCKSERILVICKILSSVINLITKNHKLMSQVLRHIRSKKFNLSYFDCSETYVHEFSNFIQTRFLFYLQQMYKLDFTFLFGIQFSVQFSLTLCHVLLSCHCRSHCYQCPILPLIKKTRKPLLHHVETRRQYILSRYEQFPHILNHGKTPGAGWDGKI